MSTTTTTKALQDVLNHAKRHLSLSDKDLAVQVTPIPSLPRHMAFFSVEEKGSYGNVFHRYVVSEGDLFSSLEEDSLGRLLKKEDYLRTKQVNADQLVVLFRLLKARMRDTEVIHAADLAEGGIYGKYRERVNAPTIEESRGSVRVTFWVKHLRKSEPEKWAFTISPDYKIEYRQPSQDSLS